MYKSPESRSSGSSSLPLLSGLRSHTPLDILPDHHSAAFVAGDAGCLSVVGRFLFVVGGAPGTHRCTIGDPVDGVAALGRIISQVPLRIIFLLRLIQPDALVHRSQFGHLKAHVAIFPTLSAVGTATPTGISIAVGACR